MYDLVKQGVALKKGGTIIGVRWVDMQKGSKVRSLLVCMDIRKGKRTDDLFAPTPPLLASRWLVSMVAGQGKYGMKGKRLMCVNFTKASLYGDLELEAFVEVPSEDTRNEGSYYARLKKAMYGLRDAPMIWQRVVDRMLHERGFEALVTMPCV